MKRILSAEAIAAVLQAGSRSLPSETLARASQ
jgi:hypothetical protein